MKYENNKIVYEVGDWVIGWHVWDIKYKNEAWQVGGLSNDWGVYFVSPRGRTWTTGVRDIRPATQEEIDKTLKQDKIFIGEYEVKFDFTPNEWIKVGCQIVDKETFLKIGKKAGWL